MSDNFFLRVSKSKRGRVAAMFSACAAVWIVGVVIYTGGADATPTVYHHTDGTFSLNRKNGRKITSYDFYECMKEYQSFGRVRLVCNPTTKLVDWDPILSRGYQADVPSYQIETSGKRFDFSFGSSSYLGENASYCAPDIINLRRDNSRIPSDEFFFGSDLVILAECSTTCEEIVAAADTAGQRKSITIICKLTPNTSTSPIAFLITKRRDEQDQDQCRFVRHQANFWDLHVKRAIDEFTFKF